MVFYSRRAIQALAFLFQPYNDIDVYVEDTACRNVYEVLINRILNGHAHVSRVFQLGGRDSLINECRKQQGRFTRPSIFVLDADFNVITGDSPPDLERLYQLEVYCCENLLFCGSAATEVAFENLSNRPRREVKRTIGFEDFSSKISGPLRGLFLVYAAAHVLNAGMETSGYHVYQLCTNVDGQPQLDNAKVRRRRREMLSELRKKHSLSVIKSVLRELVANTKKNPLAHKHMVSGKTYLLPLFLAHLRRTTGYRGPLRTLMVQLARYCNLHIDAGLPRAVISASRN